MNFFSQHMLIIAIICCRASGDTPVNCTLNDVVGKWILYEGPISDNSNIDCSTMPVIQRKWRITLYENSDVNENDWNKGIWTMVYNQGFQAVVNFRTYFSFFKYEYSQDNRSIVSICNETFVGKSHDVTLRHWACFYGKRINPTEKKIHSNPFHHHNLMANKKPSRKDHEKIVEQVNEKQNFWRAELHEPFLDQSYEELLNLRGGKKSWLPHRPKARHYNLGRKRLQDKEYLDWRDVKGVNYVSPVRDQGSCGSCYAFSSMGMLEARLRLFTNNTLAPILSPQDVVSCTPLAQGCSGGFPFLIAGRYAWETGAVEESCYPYQGVDKSCVKEKNCRRWYTVGNYEYVGGYYGACSEAKMIDSLNKNGPLSVSFEVYPDFYHYKTGVYHHTGVRGLDPFVVVNHAVLLVGYGVDDKTEEKYWIVKNSWGEKWGDEGYFKIRRGTDECGIESLAVEAFPIPY